MSEATPAQIAAMRHRHVGVHQEMQVAINQTAISVTHEIAAFIASLEAFPRHAGGLGRFD